MKMQECLKIIRAIKDVSFSTVDEQGAPQSRIIDVMLIEEHKVYFCTSRGKNFYRELMHDGRVAVVGMNREFQMVRLKGVARKLPEQKLWIDRIFDENKVMNDVYPGESRYVLEPFCMKVESVEFFDLSRHPIYREGFAAGTDKIEETGFYITDSCIECGTCEDKCPQSCIDAGTPYKIRQNNCLHCGLCSEVCPVAAIVTGG